MSIFDFFRTGKTFDPDSVAEIERELEHLREALKNAIYGRNAAEEGASRDRAKLRKQEQLEAAAEALRGLLVEARKEIELLKLNITQNNNQA